MQCVDAPSKEGVCVVSWKTCATERACVCVCGQFYYSNTSARARVSLKNC